MTRTGLTLAVTAFVAGTLSISAQGTPEQIVFARVFPQPEQLGLFIANADGSGERPLVSVSAADYNPAWTPDGTAIVFTSERNGSADLYRVKADGSGLDQLTRDPAYDDQAALSPDGRTAVFVTTRAGGTADLWTLDLTTRQSKALTSGPGGDFRPAWSPDGRWIAFSSDRESNLPFSRGRWEHLQLANIYVIRPDGTGLRKLTNQRDFCGSPKWYPDGARLLAYCVVAQETLDVRRDATEHAVPTRLVAISLADGSLTDVSSEPGIKFQPALVAGKRLAWLRKDGSDRGIHYAGGTPGPRGELRAAAWSPDGTLVVYDKRMPFQRKEWRETYSRDTRYQLTLTRGGPAFSPDGAHFAYVAPGTGPQGAGVGIGTPGSTQTQVVYKEAVRNILGPQWSADGQRLIFGVGNFQAFFNGFHSEFTKPDDRAEGGAQVALINADGTGFREVTTGPNNNAFPSLAPDGNRFVYRTFGPEGDGLRIMNLTTGKATMLTRGYDNFPLWSPRGDLIMFSRQADGDYEIYTVKPDGSDVRRLTSSRGNDAHMAWSPDGSRIVFASTRLGFKDEAVYTDAPQPYGEIYTMRADGSDVQQITDNQWEEGTPAWRPRQR